VKVLENKFNLDFKENTFNFNNVSKGIEPFLISNLAEKYFKKNLLIVLENDFQLNNYKTILDQLLPNQKVMTFLSWENTPYDYISPNKQNINNRFKVLIDKNSSNYSILLTSYTSLIMLLPSKKDIIQNLNYIEKGKEYNTENFIYDLTDNGYDHVSLELEPNEFTSRGGILDIWPVGEDKPYRLDFFGDKLESIKEFDPISQISDKEHSSLTIYKNLEPPFNKNAINNFVINYRKLFGPSPGRDLFIHKTKYLNNQEGIEHWLPLFYKNKLTSFFDFFSPDLLITNYGLIEKIYEHIDEIDLAYNEKLNLFNSNNEVTNGPINPNLLYLSLKDFKNYLKNIKKVFFHSIYNNISPNYDLEAHDNLELFLKTISEKQLKIKLEEILKKNIFKKKMIFTIEESEKEKVLKYLLENSLKNKDYVIRTSKQKLSECFDDLDIIDIVIFPIQIGFENNFLKIISSYELFKTYKSSYSKPYKNNISSVSEVKVNDYVVHRDHGIGRYNGLKTIQIADMPHDCLIIEYLESSKLYIPVENINMISKYGDSSKNITLDKLGSNNWNKRKNTVRKKIRDLANNLITQAAKRKILSAEKIEIDYDALNDFEKGFKFNETEDQISSLNEVYKDLTSGNPMDRLICGDVGFGKTEIALRATFLMSCNNLKTVIVVPTTLLAKQHYNTFKERFNQITNIQLLIRNASKKNKAEILERFKSDTSNVLICTHSIFSLNLEGYELGLIVVDEEQHFGVLQKEKIKKIKANTHLLTLSATPIPRTLHMSLIGVRDLSLITTPPVNRQDIKTTVCRFENNIIRKAISDEKSRYGQIFLIVPRIKDIAKIINKLKTIYPELKYAIAHGKLKAKEIEDSMYKFYKGKVDILISTSIVESGLDIPKANTLIVYKANNFGLAQLHQLRGRIGRSNLKGYAYFTIKKDNISDNAVRRLKALQAMDSLGAGINLSNYDLDIRGAGNLLGEEQSGQILQVGVELYQQLLKECINDIKNIKEEKKSDVQVNIKLPILIPDSYIKDLSLRLSLYRRLGEINNKNNFDDFEIEMINRFGAIPFEFKNLIDLVILKSDAAKAKIIRIDVNSSKILIYFNNNFKDYTKKFIDWVTKNSDITLLDTYKIKIETSNDDNTNMLLHVSKIVNRIKDILAH